MKSFVLIFITLFLTFALQLSANEITITVKEGEARQMFLEARLLSENLNFIKARDTFKKVLELDPDCAMAWYQLAILSFSNKEFDENLNKAMSLNDNVTRGEQLLILSLNALANNDPQQALTYNIELVKLYPQDKRANYQLANSYGILDMNKKAIESYMKAIEIDDHFAVAYNDLGYLYSKIEEYDKAEEALKKYIELIPDEANPYDSIGDLYSKTGKYVEAIKNYQKALELNPNFEISQRKIGDNLVFMGKYERAREAYKIAGEMDVSKSVKIINQNRIVLSYLYQNDFKMALQKTEDVIKTALDQEDYGRQGNSLLTKCAIAMHLKDYPTARLSLKSIEYIVAERDIPVYVKTNFSKQILFKEAQIHAELKEFKMAGAKLREYNELVEKSANNKEMENVHKLKGIIAIEERDFGKAIDELKMANQQDPYVLFELAEAYLNSGDKAQADVFFSKTANWNINSIGHALIYNEANNAISQIVREE